MTDEERDLIRNLRGARDGALAGFKLAQARAAADLEQVVLAEKAHAESFDARCDARSKWELASGRLIVALQRIGHKESEGIALLATMEKFPVLDRPLE